MSSVIASPPAPAGVTPRARAVLVITAALLVAAAPLGKPVIAVLLLGIVGMCTYLVHRVVLQWHVLAASIVLCILLIPINRYELPASLPFHLEPYRVLVAGVLAIWLASLLAQPDTRWRSTGLFAPLLGIGVSLLGSIALNIDRLSLPGVEENVIKQTSMFVSFFVVMIYVASVIKTKEQVHVVLRAIVAGGAVVAFFGLIQYRSGFNVFDHLDRVLPGLSLNIGGIPQGLEDRGGGARVYASAQHPIAFSAAMVMLVPVGFYIAREYGGRRWWIASGLILLAAMSAVARTGMVMLIVELLVLLSLKPRSIIRLWPYALPFLIVVHFAAPEALGGIKSAFLPQGGLVAEQNMNAGESSSNRLADLGPSLAEWAKTPALGQGFGTRISSPFDPNVNAFILDDQWLGTLLETGAFGFLSVLWLFARAIRRTGRAARRDRSPFGWLLAALTASIMGFAVGMITFDAFAFFQVTFLCFVMIGLAVPAARLANQTTEPTRRRTTR
jgi:hypothetical protein